MARRRKATACAMVIAIALLGAMAFRFGYVTQLWAVHVERRPIFTGPLMLDFGTQERGTVAEMRFSIANAGGGALKLDEFSSTCACQVVGKLENGKVVRVDHLDILPQEQTELLIQLRIDGRLESSIHQGISFRTNDRTSPEVSIPVLVRRVTGGIETVPVIADFGRLVSGRAGKVIMDVRDENPTARRVARVAVSDSKHMKAVFLPNPNSKGSPTVLGRLEITACRDTPGDLTETVEVFLDEAGRKANKVPVVGRVVPLVQVVPGSIVLPRASKAGLLNYADCMCTTADGSALKLDVAEASSGLSVKLFPVQGKSDILSVRIECVPVSGTAGTVGQKRYVRLQGHAGRSEASVEITVDVSVSPR